MEVSRTDYVCKFMLESEYGGILYGTWAPVISQIVEALNRVVKVIIIAKRVSVKRWRRMGIETYSFSAVERIPRDTYCDLLLVEDFNPITAQSWKPSLDAIYYWQKWLAIGQCDAETLSNVVVRLFFRDSTYVPVLGYKDDIFLPSVENVSTFSPSPFENFVQVLSHSTNIATDWCHLAPEVVFAEISTALFKKAATPNKRNKNLENAEKYIATRDEMPPWCKAQCEDYDWCHEKHLSASIYRSEAAKALVKSFESANNPMIVTGSHRVQNYIRQLLGSGDRVKTFAQLCEAKHQPERVIVFSKHSLSGCKSGRRLLAAWKLLNHTPKITLLKPNVDWWEIMNNPAYTCKTNACLAYNEFANL
ncbi:hypothetical protein [Singapore grouper iridovirus]|uniref:Uncharacterized protein n=1 Tax=Grouper iridovirus TaxID=127569 RepID=Q5GAE6_9VIRU|nr:unknown protein [Grouper iridovirus]WRW24679.1 hypothetical protein [Singapore grouper iridovirus]